MKATFRLPSKAVQYGYVEVQVDVPEDPDAIGRMYQAYVEVFQKGEKAQKVVSGPAHPALAPEVKVFPEEPQAPVQGADDPKQVELDGQAKARTLSQIMSDEDVDTEAEARAILEAELGSVTVVDEAAAPWEAEAPPAKKKPWETSGTPKKAPVVNLFG